MDGQSNLFASLLQSKRWNDFVLSTAQGLQVSLTLFIPGSYKSVFPVHCPKCGSLALPTTDEDLFSAHSSVSIESGEDGRIVHYEGEEIFFSALDNSLFLATKLLTCCQEKNNMLLTSRANIARKLLRAFKNSLNEGNLSGRLSVELSTLRQMNHIVISMFQGDEKAVLRALDLILSSIIIMLDAEGSWIKYSQTGQVFMITKGDPQLNQEPNETKDKITVNAEFSNSCVRGTLGVIAPGDPELARSILPFLTQECVIAFEIEHLFNLVREELSHILGSLSVGVLLVSTVGVITYANSAAEGILNSNTLELLSLDIGQMNLPWNKQIFSGLIEPTTGTMDLIMLSAEKKWVDWKLDPLIDKGVHTGWIITIDDRTDIHKFQEISRQAERFSITASLVSSLAHELRNPLTAAMGLLQLSSRSKSTERTMGYVDMATRELDRVNRLLSEFLLLGKPAKMSGELVYVDKMIKNLKPLLAGEVCSTGIELVYSIEEGAAVIGDNGQLTQVVMNLFRNAVEAVKDSGTITISLRHVEKNWTRLEIRDTGPGLPDDIRAKLFQPFTTTKEKGTGLGLAVSKAIVNNHGGQILGYNAPEGGAVFIVELPCHDTIVNNRPNSEILIIIKDESMRYRVEQCLRTIGYRVLTVPDFAALDELRDKYGPQLIITETKEQSRVRIEGIRSLWPQIKILGIGEQSKLYQTNASFIFAEPLDYVKLLETVKRLIGEPSCVKSTA